MNLKEIDSELFSAVVDGDTETVKELINSLGHKSLKSLPNGFQILLFAFKNNHLEISKLLINKGIQLSDKSTNALELSVLYGDVETTKIIVERGLKIVSKDIRNWNDPFFMIIKRRPVDEEYSRILDYFLNNGANIDDRDKTAGFTLLHLATINGDVDIVNLILKRKCNINAKSFKGLTALHLATKHGHVMVISLLLKHEAKHDVEDEMRQTPLHLAAVYRNKPAMEILLNFIMTKEDFKKKSYLPLEHDLLIYCSAITGKLEIIEHFLVDGVIIYCFSLDSGKTALHVAVEEEHEVIVELLLKHGASSMAMDKFGRTPLDLAVKAGSVPILKSLLNSKLNNGTHLKNKNKRVDKYIIKAFHFSVENGKLDMVRIFLEEGIDPNSETINGLVPLHIASQKGHLGIVCLLLSYGVNVDFACIVKSDDAYTSLYIASYYGHDQIVRTLLQNRADPNVNFKKRLTPLHAAAQEGHEKIVELLLEYGAEVNLTHYYHQVLSTPLLAALRSGHERIVKILLNYGANINVMFLSEFSNFSTGIESIFSNKAFKNKVFNPNETKMRYTPLHFAAESGNKTLLDMILQYNVYVDPKSIDLKTPLSIAFSKRHNQIVETLWKAGACFYPICDMGYCPFFYAVNNFSPESLKIFLDNGLIFETETATNVPLVHCAIMNSVSKEMLKFLLNRGADLNAKDANGLVPLHWILEKDGFHYKELFEVLLEYDADINVHTNIAKLSVIHMAAIRGRIHEIKLLIASGVDISCLDIEEETPYTVTVNILMKTKSDYKADEYDESYNIQSDSSDQEMEYNLNSAFRNCQFLNNGHHNPETYTSIVRIFTCELARLEAAKEEIQEQDLKLLKNRFIRPFYKVCKAEIEKMKKHEITSEISYFDMLVAKTKYLNFYVRNENVRKSLHEEVHHQFPLYREFLEVRFKMRMNRMNLFDQSAQSLEKLFSNKPSRKNCKIPILVVDEILNYLQIPDLMNLCEASQFLK